MSDADDSSDNEPAPKVFGFRVEPITEKGTVCVVVTGEDPWYVSGFSSLEAAHTWVLSYLIQLQSQNRRIYHEQIEKKRVTDQQIVLAQAALLEPKKGKPN